MSDDTNTPDLEMSAAAVSGLRKFQVARRMISQVGVLLIARSTMLTLVRR